ncbi:MAG: pyridoxal phosphate-dependent aminotransferase [Chloroflexota bacterium]|nr:pyridoxal phosphate-dependent aminotransferase [Chloroflexota bacterium]MDP6758242.1 pyridoxal phosphate-dependent aminotransferase [Chloroflexota bacterium]
MRPELASAMARLGTESAFVVLAKARQLEAQGKTIVHLEIGEPDFDTPENIVEAGVKALRDGFTHYGPSAGLPDLREAIAANSDMWRGTKTDPAEVVVMPGAKPVMFFTILALCEAGDEVLYPDPGFPIYESMISYSGAKPVPVPILPENNFRIDLDRLRASITDRTKLLILNSPSNPTGGFNTREDAEAIAEMVMGKGIFVMTDEVYKDIIYGQDHFSITSVPGMRDHSILLDGFSKSYAMTGWRLGYAVAPTWLAEVLAQLQTNCNSCTAAFVQMAGLEAITGPQDSVKAMAKEFLARRDLVVDGLNEIDQVSCHRPEGAFYVFPQLEGFETPINDIADGLLTDGGVAALAGSAFGVHGGDSFRLSFANSRENLLEGISRMKNYLAGVA